MGIIVDLQKVRKKKDSENKQALLSAYDELNESIHRLRASCPLIDCSEPVHPTIQRVNALLGELFLIKEKLHKKVYAGVQSTDHQPE